MFVPLLFYLLEEWYITVHSILYIACCTSYNTFTTIFNTCKMDAFRRLSFHERNYTEHPFCFIIHTHITYTRIILSYMPALLYVIYTSYFQISVIFHAKRLYMLYILLIFKHPSYFTLHSLDYIYRMHIMESLNIMPWHSFGKVTEYFIRNGSHQIG